MFQNRQVNCFFIECSVFLNCLCYSYFLLFPIFELVVLLLMYYDHYILLRNHWQWRINRKSSVKSLGNWTPLKFIAGALVTVFISFSISAYILETDGIEIVLTITEAKVEPSSPCKVSSSKSGAFSSSGKSSFSHETLIGLLPVAIATVRRLMLPTKLLF